MTPIVSNVQAYPVYDGPTVGLLLGSELPQQDAEPHFQIVEKLAHPFQTFRAVCAAPLQRIVQRPVKKNRPFERFRREAVRGRGHRR